MVWLSACFSSVQPDAVKLVGEQRTQDFLLLRHDARLHLKLQQYLDCKHLARLPFGQELILLSESVIITKC